MTSPARRWKYDNIRAFLMFCVVLGHFLESFDGWDALYQFIYTFHMPAFIFLSGYFAKFRPDTLLRRMVLPYLLFQTFYLVFDRYVLGGSGTLQYTTPYWLLWYLPALIGWNLLLPAIGTDRPGKMAAVLLGSAALGLAVGFVSGAGRFLTLSRLLVFFPYFAAGVYWRELKATVPFSRRVLIITAACAAAGLTLLTLGAGLSREMYYGASGYDASGGDPVYRLLLYAAGAACIAVIFLLAPDRPIPGLTAWGRHTMPIYLLHGFVVRLSQRWGIFHDSKEQNFCLALVLSLAVMAVFGFSSEHNSNQCPSQAGPGEDQRQRT